MHHERKLGVPTVSMQVAFKNASRLDEVLEWSLEVRKLGTRSFTLGVSARCKGEERLTIETVLVSASLAGGGVAAGVIPPDIRAGIASYLVDSAASR
jgi:4-hydroxybenzoyl-CoA thioesterase